MFKVISVLTLVSSIVLAGAEGDRNSNPFALCATTLSNNKALILEVRSWSFPFQLTGTALYEGRTEPVRFDILGGSTFQMSQSRPLHFAVSGTLVRHHSRGEMMGHITLVERSSRKQIVGTLNCELQ